MSRIRRVFEATFGRAPDTVWAAPGRVNIIGEHTDYNDGLALPTALPQTTVAAVARRGDDVVRVADVHLDDPPITIADVRPGTVEGWATYPAGVVWALRDGGHAVRGFDILIDGTVPVGSGLSSSAALECSVAGAVDELAGLDIDRSDLARIAQHAENDFAGAPTGIMDQSASLLCTEGNALLLDCRDLSTRQIPFDLAAAGLALLVIDTRAPHSHVGGEYSARRRSCERAAAALRVRALRDLTPGDLDGGGVRGLDEVTRRRVRHVVTEISRVEQTVARLEKGAVRQIGPLLTASHISLRDDYEVTIPQLDTAVEAALAAGALGARMTGGGFGGCAIALVPADAMDRVQQSVQEVFAAKGFGAPGFLVAPPSAGARKLI